MSPRILRLCVAPDRVVLSALLLALASCSHVPDTSPDGGGGQGATPGWWRGRTFYEIFVRSFADSDGDGDGDFRGLTAKLDYLNDGDPSTTTDLGVDALWLMPVYPSPSYHGYDVTDYRGINPDYGTLADFQAFVDAAHARGIKVILDYVLNHSSSQHPWFANASSSRTSEKRDWYLWRDTDPGWVQPWGPNHVWHESPTGFYYGIFWGGMPDLNLGNPAVEDEMVASMKTWLERGVDGFRIDAARHLFESEDGKLVDVPESHAFSKRVRGKLDATRRNPVLVAEAWTSMETVLEYYGAGDEYQLAFAFDLASAIKSSVKDGVRSELVNLLSRTEKAYAGKDRGFDAPFLSNHDMARWIRELGGDMQQARLAPVLLLAMPGSPFLYYGEEIGMQGGAGSSDENKRTIMRWNAQGPSYGFGTGRTWFAPGTEAAGVSVAEQQGVNGSLWSLYRDLIALRHAQPALALGDATRPAVDGGGRGTFAMLRTHEGQRVLLVINLDAAPSGSFTVQTPGSPRVLLEEGLQGAPAAAASALQFTGLAPRSFAFLALD